MKYLLFIFVMLISTTLYSNVNTQNVPQLATQLKLYAGTKASVQWKRIFTSPRHMKRYKVDSLSKQDQVKLMDYLIRHSADSDQPIVPGL